MPEPLAESRADSLHALRDAHRTIGSDLSLAAMLERIVASACRHTAAGHGTLTIVGRDGIPERVVRHGDARPSRPDRNGRLQAPIRSRGANLGELCLTDPRRGEFAGADAELVGTLAAIVGTAVENARLHEDARRSRDWLAASHDITRALLAEADVDMLLEVVSRALAVAEADYGALVLPTSDARLKVVVSVGLGAERFRGFVFRGADSAIGRAILAGRSMLMADVMGWARSGFANDENYGPTLIAPLVDLQGTRGAVLLMRTRDRAAFDHRDLGLLTTFAAQVALALELDDARADAARLRVLEERHRLAQDLHDNVMQRLFATGVGLQGLVGGPFDGDATERLQRHINDLDDTIDQIRSRVFGLREDDNGPAGEARTQFPRVVWET